MNETELAVAKALARYRSLLERDFSLSTQAAAGQILAERIALTLDGIDWQSAVTELDALTSS